MAHIAAIVLILGLCLPQTLLGGVILEAGEIDSSKVEVGSYAEVIYGTGEKLSTARGYIRAVDAESLIISQGLGKRIAFELIRQLILAESSFAMDRLKKTTYIPPVRKESESRRVVGKLFSGVLGGGLFALAGGAIGINVGEDETYDPFVNSLIGGWVGYLVGVPIGMNQMDPHDRFTYSLVGSLIGGAASLAVFKMAENETVEKIWPAFVICPLIGSTIMSEFSRKSPEVRRVSIGLLPGPKGRLSAVATLRF